MDIGKFDNVYVLLKEHNFEVKSNIPEHLKCMNCKRILIKPCQVPCGCRYCSRCIDEMRAKEIIVCPGNAAECKEEILSNCQLDYRANKDITRLVVKCVEKMCSYECELINMEEHMRICGKKKVKCPFHDLGCDDNELISEVMNDHLQFENYNHSKILLGMIDNIRNEINRLKDKEIKAFKQELIKKDEIIDSINEEIRLIKTDKEKLKQKFEISTRNLREKIDSIDKILNNLCKHDVIELINKEIKLMKTRNEELTKQIEIFGNNSEKKIEERCKESDRTHLERIETINTEIKEIKMGKNGLAKEIQIFKSNCGKKIEKKFQEHEIKNIERIESLNKEINLIKKEREELLKSMKTEIKSDNNALMQQIIMMKIEKDISIDILKTHFRKSAIDDRKLLEQKLINIKSELVEYVDKKKDKILEWKIDHLRERRVREKYIMSDYFHSKMKPYKLQLFMWTNGYGNFKNKGLSIWCNIYDDLMNESLSWPFKADITIKIINKINANKCIILTKHCEIKEPPNGSYESSENFNFLDSDLNNAGVMESDIIFLECLIDF